MNIFLGICKTLLVCLSLWTRSAFSEGTTSSPTKCPKHQGSDPSDVNDRVSKFANKDAYTTHDQDYKYIINICPKNSGDSRAVQQHGFKWPDSSKWTTVGQYEGAHVTGGTDWLMIKYFRGDKYMHHCSGVDRLAVILITCDPGEQKGTMKIIEEYRNRSSSTNPLECYYLFELNHDAACTVKPKHLSAGSIFLIILIVTGSVYLSLGFLYQRYVVGAKGLEQIPNYTFWSNFGSLQADGCNFMCRCSESHPTRYKTMDDALADDDRDDTLLPM
ncbi:cation-dependent mannose-6-phosphate receptor-like [Orbicella faveolata]|uniref:cation-dependent mannose-6-phosphate receptor-like n=1 Tax=Orbicella faveolata TaxID=48498 RepID=UPI0009E51029|nr:cation-dependent mannose-6-phosphate receptor-like [Orbicella faveolata]